MMIIIFVSIYCKFMFANNFCLMCSVIKVQIRAWSRHIVYGYTYQNHLNNMLLLAQSLRKADILKRKKLHIIMGLTVYQILTA